MNHNKKGGLRGGEMKITSLFLVWNNNLLLNAQHAERSSTRDIMGADSILVAVVFVVVCYSVTVFVSAFKRPAHLSGDPLAWRAHEKTVSIIIKHAFPTKTFPFLRRRRLRRQRRRPRYLCNWRPGRCSTDDSCRSASSGWII